MKQLILMFVWIFMLSIFSISVIGYGVDLQMCGDCNGDKQINTGDVLKIQRIASGLDPMPLSPQFEYCNVQGILGGPQTPGATINVLDAQEIGIALTAGTTGNLDCSLKKEIIFTSVDFTLLTASIHKAQVDGSGEVDITPLYSGLATVHTGAYPGYFYAYAKFFGPDRKIVFIYHQVIAGYIYVGIGIMDSDGSNAVSVYLSSSRGYSIGKVDGSPDGTKIAYSDWGATYEIDLATGTRHLITRGGNDPSYSPNLAFSTGIIPVVGVTCTRPWSCKYGGIAANGTLITICPRPVCTTIPKNATPSPVCSVINGTVSCLTYPVNQIAFTDGAYSTLPFISTINTDGTNKVQLTTPRSPWYDITPSWSSPDGMKITFTKGQLPFANQNRVYTMNYDGSMQTLITTQVPILNWLSPSYASSNELIFEEYHLGSPLVTSIIVAENIVPGSPINPVIINQANPSGYASVG